MIIKTYFKNLYSTQWKSLKEMGEFLDACHQPELNQDKSNNFKRPIKTKNIGSIVKNLPMKKKISGPDIFSTEFFIPDHQRISNNNTL